METGIIEVKYPAIEPKRCTGQEQIVAPDGNCVSNVLDFWQWAYSDFIGNTERGNFGEYLVACALGLTTECRVSWDKYDLKTKDGVAVEVKTSGYIQTWGQESLSKPTFGIQPTFGWDSVTNQYDTERKRQADVYVFCLHKHTDQETIDPLQISQWEFYVLPTKTLNEKMGERKSAPLSALLQAGAERCSFGELKDKIAAFAAK